MDHANAPKLKTPTVDVIENFALVLGHLYLKDQRYRDDFRVALVRTQTRYIRTVKWMWYLKIDPNNAQVPHPVLMH